jgi:hypothetical protein
VRSHQEQASRHCDRQRSVHLLSALWAEVKWWSTQHAPAKQTFLTLKTPKFLVTHTVRGTYFLLRVIDFVVQNTFTSTPNHGACAGSGTDCSGANVAAMSIVRNRLIMPLFTSIATPLVDRCEENGSQRSRRRNLEPPTLLDLVARSLYAQR